MKVIYQETKRENWDKPYKLVKAYFPDEELGNSPYMPALIQVEVGHYDTYRGSDIRKIAAWHMIRRDEMVRSEAYVIREAIKLMDEEKEDGKPSE